MDHPLSFYAQFFGGAYNQWLDTPCTKEEILSEAINSSEFFIEATKALDKLLADNLVFEYGINGYFSDGSEKLRKYAEWINSPVLDSLLKDIKKLPLIALCENNHLFQAKWLVEKQGVSYYNSIVFIFHDQGNPWPSYAAIDNAFTLAASRGHLEMCDWLRRAFPDVVHPKKVNSLFGNGEVVCHLKVCKMLYDLYGGVDLLSMKSAITNACNENSLDTIKWLVTKYDVTKDNLLQRTMLFTSIRRGHFSMFLWIVDNFPVKEFCGEYLEHAFKNYNGKVIEYLLTNKLCKNLVPFVIRILEYHHQIDHKRANEIISFLSMIVQHFPEELSISEKDQLCRIFIVYLRDVDDEPELIAWIYQNFTNIIRPRIENNAQSLLTQFCVNDFEYGVTWLLENNFVDEKTIGKYYQRYATEVKRKCAVMIERYVAKTYNVDLKDLTTLLDMIHCGIFLAVEALKKHNGNMVDAILELTP